MQLTGSSTDETTFENAAISQNFQAHQASNEMAAMHVHTADKDAGRYF
jgi:hypothetical protein